MCTSYNNYFSKFGQICFMASADYPRQAMKQDIQDFQVSRFSISCGVAIIYGGVSINGRTPKWMVYKGKSH